MQEVTNLIQKLSLSHKGFDLKNKCKSSAIWVKDTESGLITASICYNSVSVSIVTNKEHMWLCQSYVLENQEQLEFLVTNNSRINCSI